MGAKRGDAIAPTPVRVSLNAIPYSYHPRTRAEVCTTQGDKDTVWHPFRVFGPYSFDTQQPSSN
jgi:hypothetical protein